MCGIIGIVGNRDVAPVILESLERLEYRGYDSAGIAVIENQVLERRRVEGKLKNLVRLMEESPMSGSIGIGHTRWATHGAAVFKNAHPHATTRLAVVHNGIIENFLTLRCWLEEQGAVFETDTDTEVIAHLFTFFLDQGDDLKQATQKTFNRLEGSFAIGVVFDGNEDEIVVIRQGSPLVIGHGDDEMFIGSDAFSLATLTQRIIYLEDGDWGIIRRHGAEIYNLLGESVERETHIVSSSETLIDKRGHKHFMAKEIFEQPEVFAHSIANYIDAVEGKVDITEMAAFGFTDISRIIFVGCGTAYYAGMVAKKWFEALAHLPAEVEIASEFRYSQMNLDTDTLVVFISQSGETADSLAALQYCKSQGIKNLALLNMTKSSMERVADITLMIFAGTEIGVASTKAFSCQLSVLFCLALAFAKSRGYLDTEKEKEMVQHLLSVPRYAGQILGLDEKICKIAASLSKADNALFIGRSFMFPLALEGALKLKEVSYIHAEGFAAGELKHGSIALVDENLPIIVLAPSDDLYAKTISNMREVKARHGEIILVTDEQGAKNCGEDEVTKIILPALPDFIMPLLYVLPLQLLAYHTAVSKGTDVDQPRNLAKSVTVE